MKAVTALIALSVVVLQGCPPDDMATVGQQLSPHFERHEHGALVDATTLLHTYVAPNGRFRAATDNQGIVRMIIPVADDFATPEGISQASTLADVRTVTQAAIVEVPEYGFLVELPSGWTAVFCVGATRATITDTKPTAQEPVAFVCLR